MKEIINSSQTAKILGCTPQKVRVRMQSGDWKIGNIVTGNGSVQKTYDIHIHKLSKFFGISLEEIERRLNS